MAIAAIIGAVAFWPSSKDSKIDENLEQELSVQEQALQPATYLNPDFEISLRYPQYWLADPSRNSFRGNHLSYKGSDGYFGIDAVGAVENISIDEAVKTITLGPTKPYGLNPQVSSTTIAGMEARSITPSSDQSPKQKGEEALVVKYPKPVTIAGKVYYFFVIYGDKDHLQKIGESLRFINIQ